MKNQPNDKNDEVKNKEVGDNDLETWKNAENDEPAEESSRYKTKESQLEGESLEQSKELNCEKTQPDYQIKKKEVILKIVVQISFLAAAVSGALRRQKELYEAQKLAVDSSRVGMETRVLAARKRGKFHSMKNTMTKNRLKSMSRLARG